MKKRTRNKKNNKLRNLYVQVQDENDFQIIHGHHGKHLMAY